MLVEIVTGLVILIITLSLIFLKEILDFFGLRCIYLRDFVTKNSGIFTVLFIFLFFIEQIILIITTSYFIEIPILGQFVISVFALIVLTTATLEKLIPEKWVLYPAALLRLLIPISGSKNPK